MFFKDKKFNNWGRNIHIIPKRLSPKNYNELKKIINKKVSLYMEIKDLMGTFV